MAEDGQPDLFGGITPFKRARKARATAASAAPQPPVVTVTKPAATPRRWTRWLLPSSLLGKISACLMAASTVSATAWSFTPAPVRDGITKFAAERTTKLLAAVFDPSPAAPPRAAAPIETGSIPLPAPPKQADRSPLPRKSVKAPPQENPGPIARTIQYFDGILKAMAGAK